MSVFAGAISTDSRPLPAEAAERLAHAIEPYGGNRARLWKSPRAVLVHRQRVSTPEDAYEQQPMAGHAGVLALDGRLDNRDDLIAALALDARSAPLPDGRILLAALERWGDDGPRRLIGDFAFAWWDRVEHRLTLVCDQMGRRVLHYYHGAGMVVFATMVHAVQALPQVPRAIDEAVLASIILDQGLPAERTLYQGIAQVPAGGRVVVRGDVVRVDRYWEPNWSRRLRLKDDDVVEGARELLDRAVAARLRSASPVASFLSGGLDSSAVASTAARLTSPAVLKTITMLPEAGVAHDVPERCYADERPYVEAIVRQHPNIIPHFVMGAGVSSDEEDPTRLFLHVGMPLRGLAHIGWFAAATERLRALGVGVVLTGNAGNLTLSWDGERSLADLFRSGRWIRLGHEAACLGRHTGRSIASVLRTQVAAPLAPLPMREMLRRLRGRGDMPWMAANAIAPAFANQHGIPDHFRR
ncbi:MAG: asparagine synthase, partial [Alphaproteobacteria bacterium]|nr:asparagine synthase [Alphaproteobacteria bacterium]